MSAFGTKRTCSLSPAMSAFGGKADIALISDQGDHRGPCSSSGGTSNLWGTKTYRPRRCTTTACSGTRLLFGHVRVLAVSAFQSYSAGGRAGGQWFVPVHQVRIFRSFSSPLGGRSDRQPSQGVANLSSRDSFARRA